MPVRRTGRRPRVRADPDDGADRPGLARLPARRAAGPALRLPGPRPVRSRPGATASIPTKLLLDPYAKAIDGTIRWDDALFGYRIGDPEADLSRDERDSAAYMPKAVVIDPAFTWGDDRPPRTPWHETIIYEMHVKGFTTRHPDVPAELRGHLRRAWRTAPSIELPAARWGSRRSSCCRSTSSSTTGTWSSAG